MKKLALVAVAFVALVLPIGMADTASAYAPPPAGASHHRPSPPHGLVIHRVIDWD